MLTRNFKSKGGEGSRVRELPSGEDGSTFPKDVPGQVTGWRRKWEKDSGREASTGVPRVQGKVKYSQKS